MENGNHQFQRQPGSELCFVCGRNNPIGLKLDFYNDHEKVWTEFTPQEYHQGWPGVLHGGIITALLDETIGRVAFLYDKWVTTGKIEVKFRKPTPLGQKLLVTGELVKDSGRAMEMRGTVKLADSGEVLAEASGLFIRIPDSARNELVQQLGGDFSVWEEWLVKTRQQS